MLPGVLGALTTAVYPSGCSVMARMTVETIPMSSLRTVQNVMRMVTSSVITGVVFPSKSTLVFFFLVHCNLLKKYSTLNLILHLTQFQT